MNLIMAILSTASSLALFLPNVSFSLPKMYAEAVKLWPYESGFHPLGCAGLSFSLGFFLVAFLFLVFDLDIALLLRLPWRDHLHNATGTFYWATTLLLYLTLRLTYECTQGRLEWAE
uniref:NADH-ubiquinone oxidoreductase chain 3 n=1 Tax=Acrossocheilus paradoxus TaxID=76593 RepID=A0A125R6X1_ACRPD|nr:NADH dehydrogenase subunit 3 [Acrossocheilus paradoxus]AMD11928.1 NADH dehydrogenase subunit 3 [Acrossocheilus paradoxus]